VSVVFSINLDACIFEIVTLARLELFTYLKGNLEYWLLYLMHTCVSNS